MKKLNYQRSHVLRSWIKEKNEESYITHTYRAHSRNILDTLSHQGVNSGKYAVLLSAKISTLNNHCNHSNESDAQIYPGKGSVQIRDL